MVVYQNKPVGIYHINGDIWIYTQQENKKLRYIVLYNKYSRFASEFIRRICLTDHLTFKSPKLILAPVLRVVYMHVCVNEMKIL